MSKDPLARWNEKINTSAVDWNQIQKYKNIRFYVCEYVCGCVLIVRQEFRIEISEYRSYIKCNTLGQAYNESKNAKETARCK